MRRSSANDNLRVQDILHAIAKIEKWSEHNNKEDDLYQAAVAREIGVIGEAATHLSRGFKEARPQIPWQQITGIRTVLTHEYWDTQWAILEEVVNEHLPQLKAAIATEPPTAKNLDIEELRAAARTREPLRVVVDQKKRRQPNSRGLCGAWMPIARKRCVLPADHPSTVHHRSKL